MIINKGPYGEGSIISIPLIDGAWGVAVICRATRGKSILLLRLYGDRIDLPELPTEDFANSLKPDTALAILQAGGGSLKIGSWKVLGRIAPWVREEWGQTKFTRAENDQTPDGCLVVEYDDNDPNKLVGSSLESLETARHFPRDVLSGPGAVEIFLTRLTLGTSTPVQLAFPSSILSTLTKS